MAFSVYVVRMRTVLSDRLIYIVLAVAGMGLIVDPDFSTRIANLIGIGRGTDLILYTFIVFSLFHFAMQASYQKKVERQITVLARLLAIQGAQAGAAGAEDGADAGGVAVPVAGAVVSGQVAEPR